MDYTLGQKVRFSIYGSIDGGSYFEGTVTTTLLGTNLPPYTNAEYNHVNIYPALPEEIRKQYADRHTAYNYIQIQTDAGNVHTIGLPWIIDGTEETVSKKTLYIECPEYEDDDALRVIAALEAIGVKVGTTRIEDEA